MSFKKMKSTVLFVVLGLYTNMQAAPFENESLIGKVLDCVGQSSLVHWYTTHVSAKMMKLLPDVLQFDDGPAPEKYQELGKQAQTALGISADCQLPIKKMSATHPLIKVIAAVAGADAIYVNTVRLDQCMFGRQRAMLFHESAHVKYNDDAMSDLIPLAAFILATLATHKILRAVGSGMPKILHAAGVAVAGFIAASGITMCYKRHMERRADIQGHCALQCAECVRESADRVRQIIAEKNPIIHDGYLMPDELEELTRYFEQHNKHCAYHAARVARH